MREFTGPEEGWNRIIAHFPGSHLLQTHEWSQVKSAYGWQPMPHVWHELHPGTTSLEPKVVAAAMILGKKISLAGVPTIFNIYYCPKGPLLNWENQVLCRRVLNDLESFSRQQRGLFVKIDPDVIIGRGLPGTDEAVEAQSGLDVSIELKRRGWRFSSEQIQFRNSVIMDLTPSEDDILAGMKQKTRYNIRLAAKKGVSIRRGTLEDLPMLYRMYAETSVRDGFIIRDQRYYVTVWSLFMKTDHGGDYPRAIPLIAEVEGEPVAAVFVFQFLHRAYYLYGMSRESHREKMPNHLLQWEAIKYAKAAGCREYDLWGAPEVFNETDTMWGVYKFKEGLGGKVVRTLGAWDFTPHPFWYMLYTETAPRLLNAMRNRGMQRTRQHLEA
jgi:lipid II:glycine glycyltransferase (peptidoglycan interpeptide bridge formation enzyme)